MPKLPIIAADGAYNQLSELQTIPNYIVGDFDSISTEIDKSITCFKSNEQNSTDFEKCIKIAISLKLHPCIVLGALGGDPAHSLNNLNLVMQYKSLCPMVIYQGMQTIIPAPKELILATSTFQTISLMPFPTATVTTEGLKWELNNKKLIQNQYSSIHNQAIAKTVKITTTGNLFCIY